MAERKQFLLIIHKVNELRRGACCRARLQGLIQEFGCSSSFHRRAIDAKNGTGSLSRLVATIRMIGVHELTLLVRIAALRAHLDTKVMPRPYSFLS